MTNAAQPPLVAICGRPNVGKSTLFNRIIGRQRAIVHSEVGITRDRTFGRAEHAGKPFRLVDTGGVVDRPEDLITEKMQAQVRAALEEADLILFVVDGQQEITRTDEDFRDQLFKLGKPIVLAVNKLDNPRMEMERTEFYALGLGDPVAVSSGHGLGISELLDAVAAHLPEPPEGGYPEAPEDDRVVKVAVVGKPNVGKSSFANAIVNEERTIVTDVPGTTRDAIDIDVAYQGRDYLFIDTAGLRKKAGIRLEVERFSIARTLRMVRRADVCLLMIDATEGLSEQDKRIVHYVQESGTALVIAFTKWDLVEEKEFRYKALREEMAFKAPFLRHVPTITMSNLTRQRLFKVFDLIDKVAAEARKRIPTPELNRWLDGIKGEALPGHHKGRQAKVRYITQASAQPTLFVLFVNQERLFHFSYLRFIENRLREAYGFEGVPIQLQLRQREREKEQA